MFSYIGFDLFSQPQLIVLSADQFSSLINSKIFYKWIIIVLTYNLRADDFWDIWKALVLEYSLNIFLVL